MKDYHQCAGAALFQAHVQIVRTVMPPMLIPMWESYMWEAAKMLITSGNGWMIPKDMHPMVLSPALWACYKTGSVDAVPPIPGI